LNEAPIWLKENKFTFKGLFDLIKQKNILSLPDMIEKVTRAELKKIDIDANEMDRFLSLADDLETL